MEAPPIEHLQALSKLTRDLKNASITLSDKEARFLVDAYYQMQDQRIRTAHQCRTMAEEPHEVLRWFFAQGELLENEVKKALGAYAGSKPLGQWAQSICGIGPVISAGLLAHINVKVPTVGHIWRFAGLDPTLRWEKKQKRPWNASLKTLCAFKLGECFVKVQNRESDVYGTFFAQHKATLLERNEAGAFADAAAEGAQRVGKNTEAYKHYMQGKLPPAHIHARARRFAVKLFLSHYHAVGHFIETGNLPPSPYPIDHLGHAHVIAPPNMEIVPGLFEAWSQKPR